MKFRFIFTIGTIAMVLMTGMSLQAEVSSDTLEVEEVVVTATKFEQAISEVGSTVTIITQEEIEAMQARDVSEVIRQVPGLTVSEVGGRGSVASIFVRGGESDHILVLMDGIQINHSGGSFDASVLSTENIDRIEIVRGPQSALYGSEAVTAVIQIFTKKGSGRIRGTIDSAVGQRSEKQRGVYEQSVSLLGEGYSLAYARTNDGGSLKFNDRLIRNTFSSRMELSPADNLSLDMAIRIEDKKNEFPTEGGGDRFDVLDPNQYGKESLFSISNSVKHQLSPDWYHQLKLGFTNLERVSIDPSDLGRLCGGFECDGVATSVFQTNERRLTGDYSWSLNAQPSESIRSRTTFGIEYKTEQLLQTSAFDFGFGASYSNTDVSRKNRATYIQEEMALWDRFFLVGGLRMEDNSLFGTDINPKGSVAYLFRDWGLKLRSSIGTGIKNPNFSEQFGSTFSVGNPDLDPERSLGWDAGIDQSFGSWGELTVTYFTSQFRDLIAYVNDPNPLNPDFLNIQKTRSRGVEAAVTLVPLKRITLQAGMTYLSTQVTDEGGISSASFLEGKPLLRRPLLSGNWGTQLNLGDLTFGLQGRYVGERDDVNFSTFPFPRVKNPSYVVWDGRLAFGLFDRQDQFKKWKIYGRVSNLFDREYEEVFGSSSPRRHYLAGLEVTF